MLRSRNGIKETANTFHISRNTVRKYVRLFISSGKPTDQLLELTEEQLRDMFGCTEFRHREPSQRQLELDALIPDYVARLSRKGISKILTKFEVDRERKRRAAQNVRILRIKDCRIDLDPLQAMDNYGMRDEQEKCFQLQKGPLGQDRTRCWSESAKHGRMFICFVGLYPCLVCQIGMGIQRLPA